MTLSLRSGGLDWHGGGAQGNECRPVDALLLAAACFAACMRYTPNAPGGVLPRCSLCLAADSFAYADRRRA